MLEKFAVQSLVEHDGELIFSKEKFAELIVRECVAKTMEVGEQNDEPIEPIWVANCIAHRIFKHFGVEP